jgi:hypothetical protein
MLKRKTFTLKGVDGKVMEKIVQQYNLGCGTAESCTSFTEVQVKIDYTCSTLSTLSTSNPEKQKVTFLSYDDLEVETKTEKQNPINFIIVPGEQVAKAKLCFWCKYPVSERLSLPIRYINTTKTKSYSSCINKEMYHIKEQSCEPLRILTKGLFCSWNCVKAYLLDEQKKLHSRASYVESYDLCCLLCPEFPRVQTAADWQLLEAFGGPLSISDYRKGITTFSEADSYVIKTVDTVWGTGARSSSGGNQVNLLNRN